MILCLNSAHLRYCVAVNISSHVGLLYYSAADESSNLRDVILPELNGPACRLGVPERAPTFWDRITSLSF